MADRLVRVADDLEVQLGDLRPAERTALFELFAAVVERNEGFPEAAPLTEADFEAAWGTHLTAVVAVRVEGALVGAYSLKPNFLGRAAHVANAGYVVGSPWRRKGIGRAMVEDSMAEARRHGFDALQFNLVFASNPARRLYEALGFEQTGRVPAAVDGEDAYIYWRSLL
ncbi:MAG TPA: GNAT family N-acetyltransferase [Acidimicrobiales bacterium]|nr:GNAT family N-acetyltransferase [Acidimicrobiales bacterium]